MKLSNEASVAFSQFIVQEAKKRGLSLRKFAEQVGVDSSTIIRAADPKTVQMPTLEFLYKLAQATKIDICTLVVLVLPDTIQSSDDMRDRMLLAEIRRLPAAEQTILESFIYNSTTKQDNTSD